MREIELTIALLVLVAMLAWLAARARLPYPVLLVCGGLALTLVPGLPRIELHPDVVFLIFLPPILFHAGLLTSWRDFRANLRPISLLAVGLVLATMGGVAVVAYHLIEGMTWASAFVLGAIVAPPDAAAAVAVVRRLRIPHRITTILEGESLVNDASALICYRFAVAAVVTGSFALGSAAVEFIVAGVGGVIVGYFTGMVMARIRPRLRDDGIEALLALLTPYIAYLPAELMSVSGVLAAVTAGVFFSRRLPTLTTSSVRLRLYATWDVLIFLLNGLIFILIGLQLRQIVSRLDAHPWPLLISYVGLIGLCMIAVRLGWVLIGHGAATAAGRSDRVVPLRHGIVIGWTGLRGIVSLAAALALPMTTSGGAPFPGRDLIIFITFGVILVTLVLQGLTLPALIRRLGIAGGDDQEREEAAARLQCVHAALARLEAIELLHEEAADAVNRVRLEYRERLAALTREQVAQAEAASDAPPAGTLRAAHIAREAREAERRMLLKLRDDNLIGDQALRRIQQDLDLVDAQSSG